MNGHLQEKYCMFLTGIGGWKVMLSRKCVKRARQAKKDKKINNRDTKQKRQQPLLRQILERINTTTESLSGEVLHNSSIKNLTFTILRRK